MDYVSISERNHSKAAPDSWSVVIADVRGSTEAMKAGRQRDVNLVGTACIAAIRNHYAPGEVPYVFGGDGATFLVAEDKLSHCLSLLASVQSSAIYNLQLELRVGKISVADLRRQNGEISIGYLRGAGVETVPYFRGSGIALADRLIKESWSRESFDSLMLSSDTPDLSGLSCLHRPFRSRRGKILSVIVELRTERGEASEDEILARIFAMLSEAGPLNRLRPIQEENLERAWLNETWKAESKLKAQAKNSISLGVNEALVILRQYVSNSFFRLDFLGKFVGKKSIYMKRLLQQSDWIKMDGVLRLVIDVDANEEKMIRKLLEDLRQEGKVLYGIHESDSALMTCHLRSMRTQEHSHFIDGAEGGLTIASIQLKEQKLELLKQKKPS
ncbi:MAG: DUF3095 family protein [Proteobacteria bacterium]|nr:MAG: DUF3095 family protein [Pseudomonadota bacterium]